MVSELPSWQIGIERGFAAIAEFKKLSREITAIHASKLLELEYSNWNQVGK